MIRCPDCGVLKNADEPCPGCIVQMVIDEREPQRWRSAMAGVGAVLAAGVLVLGAGVLTLSMRMPVLQDTASAGAASTQVASVPSPPPATRVDELPVAPVPAVPAVPTPPVAVAPYEVDARHAEAAVRAAERARRIEEGALREAEMQRHAAEAAAMRAVHDARRVELEAERVASRLAAAGTSPAPGSSGGARYQAIVDDVRPGAPESVAEALFEATLDAVRSGDPVAIEALANKTMEHRTDWTGELYTERVHTLHRLLEVAAEHRYGQGDPRAMEATRKRSAFEQAAGF